MCLAGVCAASPDAGVVNSPAMRGAPSSTPFNGLLTIQDPAFVVPAGATPAVLAPLPASLAAETTPSFPAGVQVLRVRDSVVVAVPNVAGAADYRAYAMGGGVTFSSTPRGLQPRGAIVSCAGARQHSWPAVKVGGRSTRELSQLIEIPGLAAGNTTIVVEAIASPCPFVGLPAHTDATITMDNNGTTNGYHLADPNAYRYTGIPIAELRSFASTAAAYGNVVLNGQGASIDFPTRATAPFIGKRVPPLDLTIPADPTVIARTAVMVVMPALSSLPTEDVGPHAFVDDFEVDQAAPVSSYGQSPDYTAYNSFSFNPRFQMGTWAFWSRFMQPADTGMLWTPTANLGLQVFTRLGRLYTTFGDSGQDVGGSLAFAPQVAPIVQLDAQTYVHSGFRLNVESTHRRYWWWVMCGGATPGELYDSAAKQYRVRPLLFETSFDPGGNNPSVPDGHTLQSRTTPDDAVGVAKECLSFTEFGRPENALSSTGSQTVGTLRAQIHPANKSHGIIELGTAQSDVAGEAGFRYRVDGNGQRVGPTLPDDPIGPLTQFDVYVRPNRMVVYVNSRQTFCVDLSTRPLSMQFATITYGDLIYHSSIEWQENSDSVVSREPQLYHLLLNSPIAQTRSWDSIGHSDGVGLPANFDASLCRAPASVAVKAYP